MIETTRVVKYIIPFELTRELLHYRKALQQISVRPWYKTIWQRLTYRKKINEEKSE